MENSNLPLHLIENKRFGYLDLARGVAALGILLFHTYSSQPVFSTLYTFVDFFFVLSGFVLANSISSANSLKDLKRFLIKRVIRLFPMAGTTIVFTLLIQFSVDLKRFVLNQSLAPRIETDILTLFYAFALLQIFSNSALMLNVPLWSLSAEWIINLAGISRIGLGRYTPFVLLGVGILLIIIDLAYGFAIGDMLGRAFFGFYFGVILRLYGYTHSSKSIPKLVCSLILVVALNVSIYFFSTSFIYFAPLVFGFNILELSYWESSLNKKIHKLSSKFGKYSYGIYAWHFNLLSLSAIIEKRFFDLIGFRVLDSLNFTFILCLLLTLISTYFTIKYIEKPIQAFAQKYLNS